MKTHDQNLLCLLEDVTSYLDMYQYIAGNMTIIAL